MGVGYGPLGSGPALWASAAMTARPAGRALPKSAADRRPGAACHERMPTLMEDELRDPEAPGQMVRRQQHALKRNSARRSALLAAGIDYEEHRIFGF
eukprot:jgi/Tetstr1/460177/TSEL_005493.t1